MASNVIFYGPPGTGKTYFLQSMMSDYVDYEISDEQIRQAYIKQSEDWLLLALIFLQHHGKMALTDIQIKVSGLRLNHSVNAGSVLEEHSIEDAEFGLDRKAPRIFYRLNHSEWYVDRIRLQDYEPSFFVERLKDSKVTRRYAFVTFHQSFSYEDFVEGIRPTYVKESKTVDYSPKPGILKEICIEAGQHPENQYALFIDEINRGNIAEIFGELISLIELDKRKGMANELCVSLPYSKEPFVIPNNLSFFGTMNSADRSIETIDIALRRRFKFVPMVPDSKVIERELRLHNTDAFSVEGIDLIRLFNTINSRIEILFDRNHLLGHALFVSVRTAEDIVTIIREKVIPLLEEYFFDDLQKIQLVLNDLDEDGELRPDAIYRHDTIEPERLFSYMGDYLLESKKHYHISSSIQPKALIHIYSGDSE